MTSPADQPTPEEAADALDAIVRLRRAAVREGLHSRSWALTVSVWVGAFAVATAFDGGGATGAIAALTGVGFVGAAFWRRRVAARLRGVFGVGGAVVTIGLAIALLAIGLLGAAAYEAYARAWLPFASGALVAGTLFVVLEVLRRVTRTRAEAARP